MRIECRFNFLDGESEKVIFAEGVSENDVIHIQRAINEACKNKEIVTLDNGKNIMGIDCSTIKSYSVSRWKTNET